MHKQVIGVVLCLLIADFCLSKEDSDSDESDEVEGDPDDEPVVETKQGKLRGYHLQSRGGRQFLAFSGVPYAKPPTDHLRFQSPEPAEPWTGVRDAKNHGPLCLQFNLFDIDPQPVGKEDCLYLSVYTHNLTWSLPVMVHFHGGGFISGDGPNSKGPQFLMDEEVVIVQVNFRLGIYGFLSFEDEEIPGNQGLKDQVLALEWVHENILYFGGNPKQVTIIGESAGAVCVFLHIVSPLTKGLFHRAIAESGTGYNNWALSPPGFARNKTMTLLSLVNCSRTTTKEAVECLKDMDPLEVVTKLLDFREWQVDPIIFLGPVLEPPGDRAFLVGPVSGWRHKPVPLLMGTTSAEGLLRTLYFIMFEMEFEWYDEHFGAIAPLSLGYYATATNPDNVTAGVRDFYFGSKNISQNDWENITTMHTDALLLSGVLEGANKHPGHVYFYYFDYLGKYSFGGNSSDRNESIIFGAHHVDEIIYIWKNFQFPELEGDDLLLSKNLIKMWTHFAKYGTPVPKENKLQWYTWTPRRHRYLYISKHGFHMKEGLAEERYKFWNTINHRDNFYVSSQDTHKHKNIMSVSAINIF